LDTPIAEFEATFPVPLVPGLDAADFFCVIVEPELVLLPPFELPDMGRWKKFCF
jgi:hypothetical protein